MPDTSTRLNLPYIFSGQAQKHVTHNEAIVDLDTLVHLCVEAQLVNETVADPQDAQAWIVGPDPSEAWQNHSLEIAVWRDGGWRFYTPLAGFSAYVKSDDKTILFDGEIWKDIANNDQAEDVTQLPFLGLNAGASEYERLAIKTNSVLMSHDDVRPGSGDMRLKVNKGASGNTASLLFQNNWSGRAEMGLAGEEAFSIKVSSDGGSWNTALKIDPSTGNMGIGSDWPTASLHVDGPMRLKPQNMASLPSAASIGEGGIAYVTDKPGGAGLMMSNGSVWQ